MSRLDWKSAAAVLMVLYLSITYAQMPYRDPHDNDLQAATTIVLIYVTFILLGTQSGGMSCCAGMPTPARAQPEARGGYQPRFHAILAWHLCGWIERIPGGTRQMTVWKLGLRGLRPRH